MSVFLVFFLVDGISRTLCKITRDAAEPRFQFPLLTGGALAIHRTERYFTDSSLNISYPLQRNPLKGCHKLMVDLQVITKKRRQRTK